MRRSSSARAAGLASLIALCAGGLACDEERDTVLFVEVDYPLRGQDPPMRLRVMAELGDRPQETRNFARSDGKPLSFPTTFSLQLPAALTGELSLEVRAQDAAGATRAQGRLKNLDLHPGEEQRVRLVLECYQPCGAADAGAGDRPAGPDGAADPPGDGAVEASPPTTCGNGRVDPGETCDVAIAAGRPGACPTSCDDGITCTTDLMIGAACTAECTSTEIRAAGAVDRCCPARATSAADPDCSPTCGNGTLDPGEGCDIAISADRPGACPRETDCADRDPCTEDRLISAETCAAVCGHRPIVTALSGDGCCPAGGTSRSDGDCPVVCGNAVVEAEGGETCDRGITPPEPGACPATCDDGNACTADTLDGDGCKAVCRSRAITELAEGDGCCPKGGSFSQDSDCPAVCGNGVVEPSEACDKGIPAGQPGACPSACPPKTEICHVLRLEGQAHDCSAQCVPRQVPKSGETKDGCCPDKATSMQGPEYDADCSSTCGNGVLDPGELCDTAIPAGAGACATSCAGPKPDAGPKIGDRCTDEVLVSKGTCSAHCEAVPIVQFKAGDDCCPPGGNATLDGDCAPFCGNGFVEAAKETCDRAILPGKPGACPTACPILNGCNRFTSTGEAETCTARCMAEPLKICRGGDGCCPVGCHGGNDADCPPVCGNGVFEMGETCDRGITTGMPGACAASCDDGDACTMDVTLGRRQDCTRTCAHEPVKACRAGDGCCPAGCTPATDADCVPVCGNGRRDMGESCDPKSLCPTTCPSDDDACTADTLAGDPNVCTARCIYPPITKCSGEVSDGCCPTGCNAAANGLPTVLDVDCGTRAARR